MLRRPYILLFAFVISACGESELKEINNYSISSNYFQSGLYHTLDGIYFELNELKLMKPSNVKLLAIGSSSTGNTIPLLRLSFGNGVNANNYLFVSGTHGDEGAPVEALLFSMKEILEEQNILFPDTEESYNLDFVVIHNPDGYIENERENKNGIDLNRNFPFGNSESVIEVENIALVGLINQVEYKASLFFHSANEAKYENMVRRPIEFGKYGYSALNEKMNLSINKLSNIVQKAGNSLNSEVKWTESSSQVEKNGIASDWCVSGDLLERFNNLVFQECENSHPSLTIELCNPKQSINQLKLDNEKKEAYSIIRDVVLKF